MLLEALQLLGHWAEEDQELKVAGSHGEDHPSVQAEVAITNDIGFKWNGETYDLIADKQTWSLDVPVERFIDKVTQQYARATIHDAIKQQGLAVTEEWEMDDNSIEVLVTRWD
tara:strand:+ start:81 stop:419 length:339 start_codon:yes stop_codon:yes gene_type:complete